MEKWENPNKPIDLYDYESIENCALSAQNAHNGHSAEMGIQDGGEMGAFARESLIKTSKTLHMHRGADNTFLELGIKIDKSGGDMNYIKSLKIKGTGDFTKSGTSSQPMGRISVDGEESMILVDEYEAESDYKDIQLAQARIENRNLHGELVQVYNQKYNSRIDILGWTGLFKTGNGFKRENSAKKWKDMTNAELLSGVRNAIIEQRAGLPREYWGRVVGVPTGMYLKMQSKMDDNYNKSIEKILMETLEVRFVSSPRCEEAGQNGKDALVIISTHVDSLAFRIPKRLSLTPVHKIGRRFYFEGSFRVAGLDILENHAGFILENLS